MTEYHASIDSICNYGMLPIALKYNPLYLTALQLKKNPSIELEKTVIYKYDKFMSKDNQTLLSIYEKILTLDSTQLKNINVLRAVHANAGYTPWNQEKIRQDDVHFISNYSHMSWQAWWSYFKKLFNSIKDNGYIYDHDSIVRKNKKYKRNQKCQSVTGHVLVTAGSEEKIFITQGKTRTSIFFALFPDKNLLVNLDRKEYFSRPQLKQESFEERFFEDKIDSWLGVEKNFCNINQAREIFRLFVNSSKYPWMTKYASGMFNVYFLYDSRSKDLKMIDPI